MASRLGSGFPAGTRGWMSFPLCCAAGSVDPAREAAVSCGGVAVPSLWVGAGGWGRNPAVSCLELLVALYCHSACPSAV